MSVLPAVDQGLKSLGLDVSYLVAGFCGGLVAVFVRKQTAPFDALGTVVVGTLTANYIGVGIVGNYIGGELPTRFVVGLCGIAVCTTIGKVIEKWRPKWANGNGAK